MRRFLPLLVTAIALAGCLGPQAYRVAARDAHACHDRGGVAQTTDRGVTCASPAAEPASAKTCKKTTMADAQFGAVDGILVTCADGDQTK